MGVDPFAQDIAVDFKLCPYHHLLYFAQGIALKFQAALCSNSSLSLIGDQLSATNSDIGTLAAVTLSDEKQQQKDEKQEQCVTVRSNSSSTSINNNNSSSTSTNNNMATGNLLPPSHQIWY